MPSPELLLLLLFLVTAGNFGTGNAVMVRKCCGKNYAYDWDWSGQFCRTKNAYDAAVHPELLVPRYINVTDRVSYEMENIDITYDKLDCPRGSEKPKYEFAVFETGELMDIHGSRSAFLNLYCLEQHKDKQQGFKVLAIVCSPPKPKAQFMPYMTISLLFLISTFLVFAIHKELHNLHGMYIMYYTVILFMAYIACICHYIYIGSIIEKSYTCVFFAYIQQLCFIAAYFWFTAISFDLWWSFNLYKSLDRNKMSDIKTFRMYSIYVWGFSFVIGLITILTKDAFSNKSHHQFNIEYNDCWFSSLKSKMIWLYGPIHTVVVINFLMYTHISVKISRSPISASMKCFREKCMLYLKLFIVMSVGLRIEMVSFIKKGDEISQVKWMYQDFGAALQGVLIFFIFVCCDKRVSKLLYYKYFVKHPMHNKLQPTTPFDRAGSIDI